MGGKGWRKNASGLQVVLVKYLSFINLSPLIPSTSIHSSRDMPFKCRLKFQHFFIYSNDIILMNELNRRCYEESIGTYVKNI